MFPKYPEVVAKGVSRLVIQRGAVFGVLIVAALLAFELFNYSTTEYSLTDLLGDLGFMGFRWATILAFAFCSMDFAGLARMFTPEQGSAEPVEIWYLFGAWILAAIMNALLTWWGVSVAIISHNPTANTLISPEMVTRVAPILVAIMVFLIRVLIIGTFTVAGDRLFSQADDQRGKHIFSDSRSVRPTPRIQPALSTNLPLSEQPAFRSAPKPRPAVQTGYPRPEPSYHPLSAPGEGSERDYRF